jgi:hypothetical protein
MRDEFKAQIDAAVAKRRSELQALTVNEVGEEFRFVFQMHPDLLLGKENLIDRILAKVRAELARHAN